QVRFDTDAELDLALRTSPSPLRVTVKTTPAVTTVGGGASSEGAGSSMRSIPSTPGYAVASHVGSICGGDVMGDEGDMIMIDLPPREGVEAGCSGESMGGDDVPGSVADEAGKEQEPEEIDAPAAFEVEAAAARDPEGSMLYQKASMRLAKRFKVHLTPTQLWRVMALFQIQGRRLVIYGLAPRRALDMSTDSYAASGASSEEEEGEGAARGGGKKGNGGGLKRSKSRVARGLVASPVQRLLDLNGVDIPEDEVQPLLEALRVRPRRLVKLGLLPSEAVADIMVDEHRDGKGRRGEHSGHPVHGPGGRFGRDGSRGRGPGGPPGSGGHPSHGPPHSMGGHPREPHQSSGGGHHGAHSHGDMWRNYAGGYAPPPPPRMPGGGYGYSYGG
ncbi:unnamed protein product, partial [Laminaria digitata]